MWTNFIFRFWIVKNISEHYCISTRDDKSSWHPGSRNESRALYLTVIKGFSNFIIPDKISRKHDTLKITIGWQANACNIQASIVIEVIVLHNQICRKNVEFFQKRISHKKTAISVSHEVVVLYGTIQIQSRTYFYPQFGILNEQIVTNLKF